MRAKTQRELFLLKVMLTVMMFKFEEQMAVQPEQLELSPAARGRTEVAIHTRFEREPEFQTVMMMTRKTELTKQLAATPDMMVVRLKEAL